MGMSYTNQGLDLNLITKLLIKVIGFLVLSLNDCEWSRLTIDTIDGNKSLLVIYTIFLMGVNSI
jgi:hypothetical protein